MSAARNRVLDINELLQEIFFWVENRDVLINVQGVCKRWQKIATRSPKLQKKLFFLRSTHPFTMSRYTKNRTVAFVVQSFFNMVFSGPERYRHHPEISCLVLDKIHTHLGDDNIRRMWLRRNASWRKMFVSQPPIKEIHWHVSREDQEDSRLRLLPAAVAVFKFPDGLRIGDFYDLILGTICRHDIRWPTMELWRKQRFEESGTQDQKEWQADQLWKANWNEAILIQQRVYEEDPRPLPRREIFWIPTDLRKYRQNLTSLKTREVRTVAGGGVSWSYESRGNTQASAMEWFLRAAQNPVAPTDY
ncbi:hypothetical protein Daesc_005315 [Daldinia eschscholtzii]|uniref:F-box domain-containing protein n=1 Tax=Daldinia eschscholtzii TaxID=292717 RepID=A0AAX6MK37_9PEZI